MSIEQLLSDGEQSVRAGLSRRVAQSVVAFQQSQSVPRAASLRFANLCRRVGLIGLGLKTLRPVVHPKNANVAEASDAEIAEYAALLERTGAVKEALLTLARAKADAVPVVNLYRAFCYFASWDYETAIPCLETYLAANLTAYERLVGKVNLASAYNAVARFDEASRLLSELIEESRAGKFARLTVNCLEMRAQALLKSGQFIEARADLSAASELASSEQTTDLHFVRKWHAVLESLEHRNPKPLQEFKIEAQERGDWESLREVDLFLLKGEFDEDLFHSLNFGTPFAAYRKRIERELQRSVAVDSYIYGSAKTKCFDLATGELNGKKATDIYGKIHRVLDVLGRDRYRPQTIGGLFSGIFPGEYFDIFSSPNRVHQLLNRVRAEIDELEIPLEISVVGGSFALKIMDGGSFRVPFHPQSRDANETLLENLKKVFDGEAWFSSAEAARALGISAASHKRFSHWAIEQGHIEKFGAARTVRYRRRAA